MSGRVERDTTEELLAEVLRLPRSERVRVAGEILSTLEEPETIVAAAWSEELARRSREVTEGRVQPVNWDAACVEIQQELERRRKTELHPEAFAELRAAAFWYDEKRQGLGDALMEEVRSARHIPDRHLQTSRLPDPLDAVVVQGRIPPKDRELLE